MTTQPMPKETQPDTVWQETEELLEAPFLLATEWWLAAAEALTHAPKSPHEHQDDHHQLVVPEPFDAASEPGLFA